MKALVYVHNKAVGTAELQADPTLPGCVRGPLQLNEHYRPGQNVRLNVQLANGYFAMMNNKCGINGKNDSKQPELILIGMSSEAVDQLLKGDAQRFIEYPWGCIDIAQKIGFEDELEREINNRRRSFFGLGRPTNTHPLAGLQVSALATADMNDDVLFLVRDGNGRERYAVVHLTWNNNQEDTPAFPVTAFFDTFEDFKNSCYEIR